jgi:hypothetical protein
MRITRIYSDTAGESHFNDFEIELQDTGPIGRLFKKLSVKGIVFRENDADYNYDWHPAPENNILLSLTVR